MEEILKDYYPKLFLSNTLEMADYKLSHASLKVHPKDFPLLIFLNNSISLAHQIKTLKFNKLSVNTNHMTYFKVNTLLRFNNCYCSVDYLE